MTTQDRTTARTDSLYKASACIGYLIDQLYEMERLNGGKSPFSQNLKTQAKNFLAQLIAAEKRVTGFDSPDKHEAMDQLSEGYLLMDRLLSIMLKAGRTLTSDAQLMLNDELVGVARKYGVNIE